MIIKTDISEIQNYLVDAANYKGNCSAVYFPSSLDDITDIIKKANDEKTHVTVSGNGTGLTGGRVPEGGIVVSTEKMNKILEINEDEKFAVVQPGVLLSDFQKEISKLNLYYPPDPTEQECFIGSTVATNASGSKSFKYGSTRNFISELEIVLPTGEVIHLKRGDVKSSNGILKLTTESGREITLVLPNYKMPNTKHAAGYFVQNDMDAIDLFIGAEGTLGIITKIKLRLLDKPQNILSSVIFFNEENDALNFILEARKISLNNRKLLNNELDALALEFFDKNALEFLSADYRNIPQSSHAAVWLEQEFTAENEEKLFEQWTELIKQHKADFESSWFAANQKDRANFGEFRHAVSWKVNEYIALKNILKVGTDVAVPPTKFNELYFYSKTIVEESGLHYLSYGHFGDCHLHLNLLPHNDEEFKTAKNLYKQVCSKAIELSGTISAEHGIGKLKREYLLMMFGEEGVKQMAKLKKQIDPNLILNIGNIIDPVFYEKI